MLSTATFKVAESPGDAVPAVAERLTTNCPDALALKLTRPPPALVTESAADCMAGDPAFAVNWRSGGETTNRGGFATTVTESGTFVVLVVEGDVPVIPKDAE